MWQKNKKTNIIFIPTSRNYVVHPDIVETFEIEISVGKPVSK